MDKQLTLWISLGLIALMVAVPTLTGCNTSQYKTYTLKHGAVHFSLEYPSYYKKQSEYLQSSELAPIGIRFVHRQPNAPSEDTVFGVNISPPAPEWHDAKAAVARIISLGNTIQVTEHSPINVAGVSGELVVYLDSRMPDTPSVREVFFIFNGLLWNIFIYSDVSKADQAKADFNQILQTLKIVEPEPVLQPGSELQWYKTFSGGEGDSVLQTTDGGYIVCGTTASYSAPESYIYLIKTNANGSKLWDKAFGAEFQDTGRSVQQTTDGGYVACGTVAYGGGGKDIRLIKTDADGNTLWDNAFSGENSDDEGFSVQQTTDGGYIVCGTTYSHVIGGENIRLIKTDADGNTLWDKTFSGSDRDSGRSVQQTTDGGYIVCGSTESSAGGPDIWLIKIDADGNKLWDKTFGSENSDVGNSVRQTIDGGYIVCGSSVVYGIGTGYIWLIKTDVDGNKLWDKIFGGEQLDEGNSIQQTTDGGYIVCGSTCSYGVGYFDLWLIKTDADGNKLWDKTFGGKGLDQGFSVEQTVDGGYIVCGATDSYGAEGRVVLLLKIAPEQ